MSKRLRKMLVRISRYLACALCGRAPYRDQFLLAWLLVVGLCWILVNAQPSSMWILHLLLSLGLFALLSAICAIDARFGIIPDSLVGALAMGGVAAVSLQDPDAIMSRLADAAIVAIAIASFRSMFRWVRGYDGLGFGDVKFLAAATLWIGLRSLPVVLLVAVVSALASAFLLASQRYEVDGRHAIPFGPHLAVGLWLAWVFDPMGLLSG